MFIKNKKIQKQNLKRRKKLSPNDFTENIRQLKQKKKTKFHNNYRIVVKSTVVCFFVLFPAIYLCHLIIFGTSQK